MDKNIILIGMAGCGKSTVGVLLAKTLGYEFTDTDLILQKQESKLLQEIIKSYGLDYFKEAENRALLSLNASRSVIATGGSAVYCERGMEHLEKNGIFVWLKVPFDEISRRINNIATRGIAIADGKTLRDIFYEREPLYEKYADIKIDCFGDPESCVENIVRKLNTENITD